MLKGLAMVALASGLAVTNPGQKDGSAAAKQSECQNVSSPSVSLVCNQATAPDAKPTNNETPHWYRSPEWWLCILGVPTLYFIARQAAESRKAVEAARDSIRLQEAAYSQWITLSNWSVKYREDRGELDIHVEILNQTAFPLILNRAQITFGDKPNTATATLNEDYFLAPQIPYVIERGLHIYNDQLRAFDAGYFGIMVEGSITHTGTLKRPATQDIGGILVAARDKPASFSAFIPMHPKESAQVNETQE